MKKRTVIDTPKGPVIVDSQLLPDGQIVAEVTAVDVYKGKNVSIGLGPTEMAALLRHHKELKRQFRSDRAKAAHKKRQPK